MEDMTTEVSYKDSLTPSWMSSLPRNMGWPPIVTTAASVETRVRVLRLLNIIATVFPLREPRRFLGTDPDLMAVLEEAALRTRVVSSAGVRSAIDKKCRGAKGDVADVEGIELEYARLWTWES
jgi:hypothetical protein